MKESNSSSAIFMGLSTAALAVVMALPATGGVGFTALPPNPGVTLAAQRAPASAPAPAAIHPAAFNPAAFSSVPETTPVQKEVKALLVKGDWKNALLAWDAAFAGTNFPFTANGHALSAWLLFKNGLTVTAVEDLFKLKWPEKIDERVVGLWREAAPAGHVVWRLADIRWSNNWRKVFKNLTGRETNPLKAYTVKNSKQIATVKANLDRLPKGSSEFTWHEWQMALWSGIHGQEITSVSYMNRLFDSAQSLIPADQLRINRARIAYQEGHLKEAIAFYDLIPQSSDWWLEAVEEKAWAHLRMGDHNRTLSELKTLLTSVLAPQVGPEPYLLQALTQLKICDYSGIFKTIALFKERYRTRIVEMQNLAKTGKSPAAERAIAKLDAGPFTWTTVGRDVELLPRLFHRDEMIQLFIMTRQHMVRESAQATQLMAQARPSAVNDRTLRSILQSFAKRSQPRRDEAVLKTHVRLRQLAEREVAEMSKILTKLHLVEAEAIQRVHVDEKMAEKLRNRGKSVAKYQGEVLTFVDNEEVWLDELDNYDVKANGCPSLGGKTL